MLLWAALFGVCLGATPNVLFLMTDQQRFDLLGVNGNPAAKTPNLDKLANGGLRMLQSYTSTPTCTPARAALLTGMSPWGHGMLGYGSVATHYPHEMPRSMAAAGYRTVSFGKDHFGWNKTTDEGYAHGFEELHLYDGLGNGMPSSKDTNGYDDYDQWFQTQMPGKNPLGTGLDWNTWRGKAYIYPEHLHPTAWVGRGATQWITEYNGTKPFFAKVSFHRPHSPYDPPARLLNATKWSDLPPYSVSVDGWDNRFRGQAGDPKGCGGNDAWCGEMPPDEVKVSRRAYYASVQFVDEWVGHIMDALEKKGILENTFILFTSDHGDMQSDHWHWRKGYPYEGSAHVNMLVRWPESMAKEVTIARGSTSTHVSELRDVFPTFLAVAGANPLPLEGTSLTCLLKDPTGAACKWREYLDLEHSTCYNETNHWNALTDGKMKYIFRAFFGAEQLFDLTADPHEKRDLSTDPAHAQTLALWRQRMVKQFEDQKRGPTWVKDGKLQVRTKGQTYGPNYPGKYEEPTEIPSP